MITMLVLFAASATLLGSCGSPAVLAATAAPVSVGSGPTSTAACGPNPSCPGGSAPTPAVRGGASADRTRSLEGETTWAPTGEAPDAVLGTASLLNDTLEDGVALSPSAFFPSFAALDPANGLIYVANTDSNTVEAFSSNLTQIVATIPVGSMPVYLAFDSETSDILVSNWNSGNLSIINGSTNRDVGSVKLAPTSGLDKAGPYGLAYDPAESAVFVGEVGYYVLPCSTYNVTEIDANTFDFVQNISTGICDPQSVTLDTLNQTLEVSYALGNELTVINATSGSVMTTVSESLDPFDGTMVTSQDQFAEVGWNPSANSPSVEIELLNPVNLSTETTFTVDLADGTGPAYFAGMAYVPSSNSLWLAGAHNVYLLSLSSETLALALASPRNPSTDCLALGYGGGNDPVLVADGCTNQVVSFDALTAQVDSVGTTGIDPGALEDDPAGGAIYIADRAGAEVEVLNSTTLQPEGSVAVGPNPIGLAYVPSMHSTFVLDCADQELQMLPDGSSTVTANLSLAGPAGDSNGDGTCPFGPVVEPTEDPSGGYESPGGFNSVNGIAYSNLTGDLYVAQVTSDNGDLYSQLNLTVIDPESNSVLGNIPVRTLPETEETPYVPVGVAVVGDGGEAVVTDPWDGDVYEVSLTNGSVLWNTSVGGDPEVALYDPADGDVAVAVPENNEVVQLVAQSGAPDGKAKFDLAPSSMTYDPLNHRLYVGLNGADGGDGMVSELDAWTLDQLQILSTASNVIGGAQFLSQSGMVGVSGASNASVYFLGQRLTTSVEGPTAPVQGVPFEVEVSASYGDPPYSESATGSIDCQGENGSLDLSCVTFAPGTQTLQIEVSDEAGETVQTDLVPVVSSYPLAVSIGLTGTNGSVVSDGASFLAQVDWPAGQSGSVENATSLDWSVSPGDAAAINVTSGAMIRVSAEAAGPFVLSLNASFYGTRASATVNLTVVEHPSPTPLPPATTSSSFSEWIELGILGAIGAVIGATVVLLRRRRRRASARPP